MFNRYYQDELAYLRDLGREFAQAYPQLAPMLADRGGDPDVERLLEGVAFLTGRIRQKLDDELPEAVHAIAEMLFPHLVRPLPSAAILELTPLPGVLRERHTVPAGAEFGSIAVDGVECRFRSCAPCELAPWVIDDVRLESLGGGKEQLRIELRVPLGLPIAEIAPDVLRLHLAGEARQSLGLLMWIREHTEEVVLVETKPPPGNLPREILLGKRAFELGGTTDAEALLPFGETAFPGFRLLEEYYVLPSKFAFVDVRGVKRAQGLGAGLDGELSRFALAFRFDAPVPNDIRIHRDSVKLHCVPIVNIFETTADPIRLTPTRGQFLVRPAGLPPAGGEVYAITEVEALAKGRSERIEIPPFFTFAHAAEPDRRGRSFYTTHVRPSVVGDGADVLISFGTPENAGVLPDADVASLRLLATNRGLASALRAGEVRIPTPSSPAVASFRNLAAATPHVPPPLGRDLQWRVVAHAAMGLRSLAQVEVLRAVLDVYNLHALVDRQAARANELRIAAVREVVLTPSERLYRGAPVRGVKIDVHLDEAGFAGDGDMFLFGQVLDRFFSNYVSLNSFSRTTIHGVNSKLRFEWEARSGDLTML